MENTRTVPCAYCGVPQVVADQGSAAPCSNCNALPPVSLDALEEKEAEEAEREDTEEWRDRQSAAEFSPEE